MDFRRTIVLAIVGSALIGLPVLMAIATPAQTAPPQTPTGARSYRFDVVSIKPTPPVPPGGNVIRGGGFRGGRYNTTGSTLKALMATAYGVQNFQISGGPGWIDSDRFDIQATAEGEVPSGPFLNPADNPLPQMLRLVLEDRFKLKVHRETKEMPIYALVVEKNGPKTLQSKECEGARGRITLLRGQLVACGVPMSFFINYLSGQVARVIVDKTNLTGEYDLKLEWIPDQTLGLGLGGPGAGNAGAVSLDPGAPNLFTAIEDQLGLKLESQRGPVTVMLIDSVEKPSEN